MIDFWLTTNKLPDVFIKAAKLLLDSEKRFRIVDRRFDFQAVAHNSLVPKKLTYLPPVIAGNLPRVKPIERFPVVLPLSEYRDPAQSGLRSFKDEHLEEHAIIVDGDAPFLVVILKIERISG